MLLGGDDDDDDDDDESEFQFGVKGDVLSSIMIYVAVANGGYHFTYSPLTAEVY